MDIIMLALTNGGRVSTQKEFHGLLKDAGLNIINIIKPTISYSYSDPMNFLNIIEAVPSY
jgi:hypothetical protein